jgi:hypothetical protein
MTTGVCVGMGVNVADAVTENLSVGETVLKGVNVVKNRAFAWTGRTEIKIAIGMNNNTKKFFGGFILH